MQINANISGKTLRIALEGEMDEHTAKDARMKADDVIDRNPFVSHVVFDLKRVAFMDSTGIGFLIGRYKKLKRLGVAAYIAEPNATADKILLMSGVYMLIPKINAEKGERV